MGVFLAQAGKPDQAIELIRRSIALNPASPQARSNQANVLKNKIHQELQE